jgi:hypothetical protein
MSIGGTGVLAGCIGGQGGPTGTPTDMPTDSPTPTLRATDTSTPPPTEKTTRIQTPRSDAIEPIISSGNGTKVIQNQELKSGIVVADVTYSNPDHDFSSIQVTLRNVESGRTFQLFGDSGPVENGEGANVVDETGEYHVDVESQGDWEITISQPRATREDAATPPIDVSGTDQTVTGPYYFDGTGVLIGTNDAEGDFIVTIWPMEGPWGAFEMPLLESGAGDFESSFSFDGIGYIHVKSAGDWGIRIE